jgi:ADP-ribosylglycohydrolase
MPGSFQSAMRALIDDTGFVNALREVITAGGCNCSRSCVVGACLGAKYGIEGIPLEWIKRTLVAEEAIQLALKLVSQ